MTRLSRGRHAHPTRNLSPLPHARADELTKLPPVWFHLQSCLLRGKEKTYKKSGATPWDYSTFSKASHPHALRWSNCLITSPTRYCRIMSFARPRNCLILSKKPTKIPTTCFITLAAKRRKYPACRKRPRNTAGISVNLMPTILCWCWLIPRPRRLT